MPRRFPFAAAGAALLALAYGFVYLGHSELPGNNPAAPLGWWTWFDQGKYLSSARALNGFDPSPARHWYPLGYPLLGAPFARRLPAHPFFFVDLAGLLLCYAGALAFARRIGVEARWAVPVLLLSFLADGRLFESWVVPWSTTPVAALIWLMLAMLAAHVVVPLSRWRLVAFGAMAAGIVACRPTDVVVPAVFLAVLVSHDLAARRFDGFGVAAIVAGAALVAVPYGALHLFVYGWRQSDYMAQSARLGFAPGDLGFKAFVLLVDPRAWFGEGEGIFTRAPWLLAGLAGFVPAFVFGRAEARWALAALAGAVAVDAALYLSYVDMLPTGTWRYNNVHYFAWIVPALALAAVVWLRHLLRPPRGAALAGMAAVLGLSLVRIVPVPAAGEPARLAVYPGVALPWNAYFDAAAALRDRDGVLTNIVEMRLIPGAHELRAVALRRDFAPPLAWAQAPVGMAQDIAPALYAERVRLGWPCTLPPWPCGAAETGR